MTIAILRAALAPPANPPESEMPDGWLQLEETLRSSLPADYKDYISAYGTSIIAQYIIPYNPFSANPNINLMERIGTDLDAQRIMKEKWGASECPYPLYPEPGGLLPWGNTENGDVLFWQMIDDPAHWSVVVNESRGPRWEQHEDSMTSFLAKFIRGELTSGILRKDTLDIPPIFESLNWPKRLVPTQWESDLLALRAWISRRAEI